jgi:hypothetical protein
MDEIVRQAMAKWPNVPHCYGWLALDRRGQWCMRDEAAQAAGAPGDPIRHAALIAFIARNYACDEGGRWYFQNGPQRVYVALAYAPFVVRLTWDAQANGGRGAPVLADQLGRAFAPQACLLDEDGNVAFVGGASEARAADESEANSKAGPTLALLHDHDIDLLTQVSDIAQAFEVFDNGEGDSDAMRARQSTRLHWRNDDSLPFAFVRADTLAQTYGFERNPQIGAQGA